MQRDQARDVWDRDGGEEVITSGGEGEGGEEEVEG